MPSNQQPRDNQKEDSKNPAPQKTNWVEMSNYAELAIVFPAATVIGWLIGVGLDKWLHTTWLYIVGLLLGIAAGFVQLIRTASKNT
jgi:F0F1-type ATP synthase assembly protein I